MELVAEQSAPEPIASDEPDEIDEPEPEPEPIRVALIAAPEEPEVEQELPPRPEPRSLPVPDQALADEAEHLMNRGAPFSPAEMGQLHDFVTAVRGQAYWDMFKNRQDLSVLRHAEGALRHYQTVIARKK